LPTPAYCTELNAAQLKGALADSVKEKAPSIRVFAINNIMECTTPPSQEDMVGLNRSLFSINPQNNKKKSNVSTNSLSLNYKP